MPRKKKVANGGHPDQQHIEGMAPERNERVYQSARYYKQVRDARIKASRKEKEGKDKLIEVMVEEGLEAYVDPGGLGVIVTAEKNVKLSEGVEPNGKAGEASGEE